MRYFTFEKPSKVYTYNNGYKELDYNVIYKALYNGKPLNLKFMKTKPQIFKNGVQNAIANVKKKVNANKLAQRVPNKPSKVGPEKRVEQILKKFPDLKKSNFQKKKVEKKRKTAKSWVWDQGKIAKAQVCFNT